MTDIITGPGNYCRADGVKVEIASVKSGYAVATNHDHVWLADTGEPVRLGYQSIISTWRDRPAEFRKPKPAYRKDGTSRWPVGTKAIMVAWEHKSHPDGGTMTVHEDGPRWDNSGLRVGHIYNTPGTRPLFRPLRDPIPRDQQIDLMTADDLERFRASRRRDAELG